MNDKGVFKRLDKYATHQLIREPGSTKWQVYQPDHGRFSKLYDTEEEATQAYETKTLVWATPKTAADFAAMPGQWENPCNFFDN